LRADKAWLKARSSAMKLKPQCGRRGEEQARCIILRVTQLYVSISKVLAVTRLKKAASQNRPCGIKIIFPKRAGKITKSAVYRTT